ncbi:MAG: 30S ribosomal protein S27e [Candidatus Nanohalarchaeota archaeon]|nr:MAG: 30S ribosomal protein S27e [Candidatus Nanohaloarchaeota archaeon]
MAGKFLKVRCTKCKNEQTIFSKATEKVKCLVCGADFALPTGGKAELKNLEIISEFE